MKKNCATKIIILLAAAFITGNALDAQTNTQNSTQPPHIAYDIKAERIKFSNDSIKITWKMNSQYQGDFIVGRSEKELLTAEDTLQATLIGIFSPKQDGIAIDRDVQPGKKYYYIVLARTLLIKRNIDIIKNVNYTAEPVSLFIEPESVQSLRVDVSDDNKILINWKESKSEGVKYNVYRSKSPISTGGELEVAEKIASTEKNEYKDKNLSDYGTYFYAVTIIDKNGIEYFNPKLDQNYTSNGIFLKGNTLATPLNVGAFLGLKNSIIVKWEKAESRTGKDLQGYEIYRSDEPINTLLKLKFSKLVQIVDNKTTVYTDKDLAPGKYCYAVFARYSDGTVDINFETDSNYIKTPLIITMQYRINSLDYEIAEKKIILRWNYTGNSGNETVSVFKTSKIPADSGNIMNHEYIGTENIKSEKFIINDIPKGNFYYGVLCRNENEIIKITPGVNLTTIPFDNGTTVIEEKQTADKKPSDKNNAVEDKKPPKKEDTGDSNTVLDRIIHNTYYKSKYELAVKELKNYIKTADNPNSRAKAKLFLAKAYIELHEYGKSIKLLESDEVKGAFPEESRFWSEFALVRLK